MTSDEDRWRAVQQRNASLQESFVYGVVTTGIFCRASCPSRRPKRENVRFFDTPAEARGAGFRACKRCLPEGRDPRIELVRRACARIEVQADLPSVSDLARDLGVSESHLHRVFRGTLGLTPHQWARARRGDRVRELLREGSPVTDAAFAAGYTSTGRFYEDVDDFLGMTPSRFRAGGDGLDVVWSTGSSSLGRVLAAGTPVGLCALLLGDDDPTLLGELERRFAGARLHRAPEPAATRLGEVIEGIDADVRPDLPLDLRGTAFQIRVWRALTTIPRGTTVSYGELARRLGRPGAARAVGTACAANPVAVYVPCHRVVRADGSVAGYRWGLERRRRVIDRETGGDAAPL